MTQTQAIKSHLLKHNSITPGEALRKYGCMRLAARVWQLKQGGFSVVSTMVRRGEKRFCRYVMG